MSKGNKAFALLLLFNNILIIVIIINTIIVNISLLLKRFNCYLLNTKDQQDMAI